MMYLTENNLIKYINVIAPIIFGETMAYSISHAQEVTEETYVNYIFRVMLSTAKGETIWYLRQTRDHVKTMPERKLEPDRIIYESKILLLLNGVCPGVVPCVLYLDAENNIAVLSDIKKQGSLLVKELVAGQAHPETGYFFGKIIGEIHGKTLGISHKKVRGDATANKKAVDFHLGMRLEPALRECESETKQLLKDGKKQTSSLVLGDLASKNIFVDGNKVRFLDLERSFVGDPAFDTAFLFCHYLIEISPTEIYQSIEFIDNYMRGYSNALKRYMSGDDLLALHNRIIRYLGVTILYRLFGLYLVISVERNKEQWTEIAKKLLSDTVTASVTDSIRKLI